MFIIYATEIDHDDMIFYNSKYIDDSVNDYKGNISLALSTLSLMDSEVAKKFESILIRHNTYINQVFYILQNKRNLTKQDADDLLLLIKAGLIPKKV
ncbi:hypothetical protein BS623_02695 [Vibrio parahaemolyticus]|uniref:hypothetical protein n=1 Tax=Vibrio parahaemolyticus TaxID=670 RepID=UPI000A3910E6|nr:hypothetical protein [Vibrio parahaemolyticus]OUD42573.1 hypothetical protein BS623_02695 [Vibrio parahaemolyticus]OUJ47814.1 hypothetical protein BTZ53_05710 [Vibrio parahaemolyticus]